MRRGAILAVLALGLLAGCGDERGSYKLTGATLSVEALVRACKPAKLRAFSDVGEGSSGSTSSWVGLCSDGQVVEVHD